MKFQYLAWKHINVFDLRATNIYLTQEILSSEYVSKLSFPFWSSNENTEFS